MSNDKKDIDVPGYEYDETERRRKERRTPKETETKKTVILDTNVFLEYGPSVIFQYKKNDILITESVRDELNHHKTRKTIKGENRRRLENGRKTISFLEQITERYSLKEIKNGLRISALTKFIFGEEMRTPSTGLLFLRMEESKNDPLLFSKEFRCGEVVSLIVKTQDGTEKTVSVSEEVALRIQKALWDIQDREILSFALSLQKSGENILLVTEDIYLRQKARLAGVTAKSHEHGDTIIIPIVAQKKRRRGRKTSQRKKDWN